MVCFEEGLCTFACDHVTNIALFDKRAKQTKGERKVEEAKLVQKG